MSVLSLRLPDSLHEAVKVAAEKENASINQLISTAVAEKISALLTEDYILERAKRGSKAKYLAVLDAVPDVDPVEGDAFIKKTKSS